MSESKIGFIGAGNMGGSLIGGLIADGYCADHIWASNKAVDILNQLQQQFGIHTSQNNIDVCEAVDIVVLAVKPQIMQQVLSEVGAIINQRQLLVISIAAGIREHDINQWLGGGENAIVRCMPNTPALIRAGATALYANAYVDQQQKNIAESILRAVGITVWLEEENLLDIATALSGSGPAYFFLFMEALCNAAVELGLPEKAAKLLSLQTGFGATRMALESDVALASLRERVTSPGGTTEKALNVLQQQQLSDILAQAVTAARDRAEELAQLLSQSS